MFFNVYVIIKWKLLSYLQPSGDASRDASDGLWVMVAWWCVISIGWTVIHLRDVVKYLYSSRCSQATWMLSLSENLTMSIGWSIRWTVIHFHVVVKYFYSSRCSQAMWMLSLSENLTMSIGWSIGWTVIHIHVYSRYLYSSRCSQAKV